MPACSCHFHQPHLPFASSHHLLRSALDTHIHPDYSGTITDRSTRISRVHAPLLCSRDLLQLWFCDICPAGTYSNSPYSTSCTTCSAGKYLGVLAPPPPPTTPRLTAPSAVCDLRQLYRLLLVPDLRSREAPSDAGTTATAHDGVDCSSCSAESPHPASSFDHDSVSDCTICGVGTFSGEGEPSCPSGKYSTIASTSCTNCPPVGISPTTPLPFSTPVSLPASTATLGSTPMTSPSRPLASPAPQKVLLASSCTNCPSGRYTLTTPLPLPPCRSQPASTVTRKYAND